MNPTPTKSKYIQAKSDGTRLPPDGKADALISDGATEIKEPLIFPAEYADRLVCVVENQGFDAALFVCDEFQYERTQSSRRAGDPRPTRWLLYPKAQEVVAE